MKKDVLILILSWLAMNICSYISFAIANKTFDISKFGNYSCGWFGFVFFVTSVLVIVTISIITSDELLEENSKDKK